MQRLFRREALAARAAPAFGATLLAPPLSFTAWSAIATLLALAAVAFLVFGEYTRRSRIAGITVPASGLVKLVPPQPGVVVERHADEGQRVRAGDVLFVLTAERLADAAGAVAGMHATIVEQLTRRRDSLELEAARAARLVAQQLGAAGRRLDALQAELAVLDAELATQAARIASTHAQLRRFEELHRRGFTSELAVAQKRDEWLEQTARRHALERTRLAALRDAEALADERRQLPLRGAQQQAEFRRAIAALAQDIAAAEAQRRIVVVAPHDGVVTAILAEPGQAVSTQPLATLLPRESVLQAHLFAPSRAAGFVAPGQPVRIRYAAFPYQKFGQHAGRVVSVSRAALAPGELPPQLAPLTRQGEALYRIAVSLDAQHVVAYGRPQPLVAGMQLEADVLQDRRRLVEWVFEPLLGLRGTL